MRIVHVFQPSDGGVPHYVGQIAGGMAAQGHSVTVIGPIEPTGCAGLDYRRWTAPRKPGIGSLAGALRLRSMLRHEPFDVVHLHSASAGAIGRCLVRGRMPTIYQPHAWSYKATTGVSRRVYVALEKFLLRWTNCVAASGFDEVRELRRLGSNIAAVSVGTAVDLRAFRVRNPSDAHRLRSQLGLEPTTRIVVSVGRLTFQKGVDTLVRRWAANAPTNATLLIVGAGDLEGECRTLAAAEPSIRFLGKRDDVADILAGADLFVLTSRWEGSAIAVTEAMAAGLPVVATPVDGVADALIGGGYACSGELLSADATDLADVVGLLLADGQRRESQGRAGRARAELNHSLDSVLRRVVLAYEAIAGPGPVETARYLGDN